MELERIYAPVREDLDTVESVLHECLTATADTSMSEVGRYVLESGGKRVRPALVLLSAKASGGASPASCGEHMVDLACAVELIHMASLLHDDVVDNARLRHHNPTINMKWGDDVSIALGDYLYSVAFELISRCDDSSIVRCMSAATKSMCEGQLLQIWERKNLELSMERYVHIVEKKTAALFAASAQVGASLGSEDEQFRGGLGDYGLSLGVSFQIVDDYLDLIGDEVRMGKEPGQDIAAGEATLPILVLWEFVPEDERQALAALLDSRSGEDALGVIREKLLSSGAARKTQDTAIAYVESAKKSLDVLAESQYKVSLLGLADFVLERGFATSGLT
jgi:octaprenyl-diphosphate synthase